jgi:hypothetical protein
LILPLFAESVDDLKEAILERKSNDLKNLDADLDTSIHIKIYSENKGCTTFETKMGYNPTCPYFSSRGSHMN